MPTTNVAVRLGVDGEAEIVRAGRAIRTELGGAFNQVGEAADGAAQRALAGHSRMERQYLALAAAQRQLREAEEAQWRWNTPLGVGVTPANDSGLTAEYFAEMERAEAAAQQLRAQIDPLSAAQDRYNREVAEAKALLDRGAISAREYGQAQEMAKGRLDATTLALQNQERGLSRLAVASRLNLARQGADVLTTAAMGMNPAMIAIQQGPQILDAWSTSGIKATGAMVALGGAVATLAAGVGVAGFALYQADEQMRLAESAATGLGRTAGLTGREIRDLAAEAADAAGMTEGAATRMAAAYVSTGVVGRETLGDLIVLTREYAAFMGIEAPEAQERLAAAMRGPTQAARDMTLAFGLADQATLDQIATLEQQGDRLAANELLLDSLADAMDDHRQSVNIVEMAWRGVGLAIGEAIDNLGQFLAGQDEGDIDWLGTFINRRITLRTEDAGAAEADPDAAENQQAEERRRLIAGADPQAGRAGLEARRDQLIALRGDATLDQAAIERGIANLDRQIEGLGRTARETRTEAERLAERIAESVMDFQAGERAAEALTAQWLGLARAQAEGDVSRANVQAAWAAGAAEEEARRDATIDGIVREDLARARLRAMIADQTTEVARSSADLTLETTLREDLNARLAAGTLRVADYDRAQEQAALAQQFRIALLTAEQDQMDALAESYGALRDAMDAAWAAEAETDRLRFIREAMDDADDLLARIGLINAGATEAEQRIADAVRDARRNLEDRRIDPESPEGQEAIGAARTVAEAENDLERAEAARRYSDELTRQNELVQAQLSLVWLDERSRDRILRRLELINDLVADGLKLEDEKVQAILRQHDAYEDMSDLLDRQMQLTGGLREDAYDTWTEMRQALSDGQEGWERMGDIGEDALKRIAAQVLALAILNPFENWAFGSNLPTFGNLGDGFWSAAANGAGNWFSNFLGRIPGFATGTDDAPEGMAWVGEHGKELMQVPGGTRIYNHGQSMGIASRSREAAPVVNLNINLSAEGADAEALARLERRLDDLPGEMLELVGEADSRFILRRR